MSVCEIVPRPNAGHFAKIAVVLLMSIGLIACESNPGPKQQGGTVVGAVAGGLLGSTIGGGRGQVAAIAVGAVLGGIIGSEVGKSLDRADRAYMHRTTQRSLEYGRTGETSTWVNPDNQHAGSVTPTRTLPPDQGQTGPCREFQQTVTIDGRSERAYGTACRQADGSWKIQN
ncbi:MAG TPA: RT0821/Lpp0805 family surface protein [Alphaproteobacteria bacterium]|nr:RT0821/Lpp0805 family surface protein [Alphaproteobacteria bacterium]